jgi:inhibitor of KinA sporulation pathway (predicted exonuclease)
MILTAFDLEMNQPSGKIIQLGYCFGDTETGEILFKNSILVQCWESITPYIEKLTGITNMMMIDAVPLPQAFDSYVKHILEYKPFMNPLTWGNGDVPTLRDQLGAHANGVWPFGRRYDDVKAVGRAYRLATGLPTQGSLAKTVNRLGLKFEGRKHNAECDAVMTFMVYYKLLTMMKGMKP